jgi:hypothetical protein
MKIQFVNPYGAYGFTKEFDLPYAPREKDLVDIEGSEYSVRRVIWMMDDEPWVYVVLN